VKRCLTVVRTFGLGCPIPYPRLILSEPFLEMCKLNCTGFNQIPRSELSDPVVMDIERRSNHTMLPYPLVYLLARLLDAFFYRHMC
jgi:hypothetical protein